MTTICTSAPGKAFIIGEFCALSGGPALLMAVDRRVGITVTSSGESGWTVHELPEGKTYRQSVEELAERDARGDLVAAVVQTLRRVGVALPPSIRLSSDRSALLDATGRSLGLGSSAASCVAITAALAWGGNEQEIRCWAVGAHCRFQAGLGSGYDVVCSSEGGLVAVRRKIAHRVGILGEIQTASSIRRVDRVGGSSANHIFFDIDKQSIPSGLDLIWASGGRPIDTPGVLAELCRAAQADVCIEPIINELAAASQEAIESLAVRDVDRFIQLVGQFLQLEERLGKAIGREIVPTSVRELARTLRPLGGTCKPSGAGGEELLLAVVPSDARSAAIALVEQAGFVLLVVGCDPVGLSIETGSGTIQG